MGATRRPSHPRPRLATLVVSCHPSFATPPPHTDRSVASPAARLGSLPGFPVSVIGDPAPSYGGGSQMGYLGVMGAALGALVAGFVGVLVDRRQ